MDALTKFLDDHDYKFDVSSLISPEVAEFDRIVPPPRVYKYLGVNRIEFFRNPVLRFTQRTKLNDPFELSKRWQEFASAAARRAVAEAVKDAWRALAANKGTVLEILKQKLAKEGTFLGPDQMAEASQVLLTAEGRRHYDDIVNLGATYLDQYVETGFACLDFTDVEAFEEVVANLGILSLTENPVSPPMWALYASEGHGFVVEFDTTHPFFLAPNGRNLLWQVNYSDDRSTDFLSNPLSLLLTKHEEYSFEREWRLVKKLSDCDETVTHHGQDIHLCRVKAGMIKSVIFGYNYEKDKIAQQGAWIRTFFDPGIHIHVAVANRSSGKIELHELT